MADDMVTLRLAGPISVAQAAKLRAKEVKDYPQPGLEITVPRDEARALIDAGYASGVEPTDTEAVAKALGVDVATAAQLTGDTKAAVKTDGKSKS